MSTRTSSSRLRAATGATAVAAVSAAGLVLGSGAAAAATTTLVLPSDLAATCPNDGLCVDVTGTGTATFVDSPQATDAGAPGALELSTPDGSAKAAVRDYRVSGTPLSDITDLSYVSTVLDPATSNADAAPALNVEIDSNGPDLDGGYTTLVWEPIYTGSTVTPGVQQTYSPSSTPSGSGGWWATRNLTPTGTANPLGFNTYTASFADVKAALPDATLYSIGVNQGSGSPALRSAVDLLTVNDKVYDFELQAPPLPAAEGRADLAAVVTAPPFSDRGTDVPVEVTVTNRGQNPSGPTTATAITPGYTVSAADGTINDNGSVTLAVPYLAPGASATFSITADGVDGFRLGFAGVFVAPAPGQPDPNLFNNIGLALAVTR